MGCIYRFYCIPTRKSYIGQYRKNTPDGEWNRYCNEADRVKNSTRALIRAIQKYGRENFQISVLCICDPDNFLNKVERQAELDKKEQQYITDYKSMIYENGYNMVPGGKGRAPNFHHKEEHKKKLSDLMKGRKVSDKTKQKLSEKRKGTKCNWSDETRQRVSDSSRKKATGHIHSEETKRKIGEKSKGRQATKGQKRTEEQKKHIGDASRGRKFSEETKQQLSEIHFQRHKENPIPHKNCKYTEDDIRYMRNNPDNLSIQELRDKFNIARYRLLQIQNRELYKNVKD